MTSTDLELRSGTDVEPQRQRANIDHDLTDSWVSVIRPITILAQQIADTSFVPAAFQGNPPAVAAAILHGRELGLAPMTALALTDPIKGKPTMKAEGLRALVLAAGHEIETTDTTGARCVMRGRRRGEQRWTEIVWTIEQARAAGLTSKDTWKSYPRAMLQARATSELLRLVFPDVIHGMGFAEEIRDQDDDDGDAVEPTGSAPEAPRTTVSRAPRAARKTNAGPRQVPEPGPVPSTPPAPLEVEVPMPDAPAPSGPGDAAPGPEVGDLLAEASVARQALEEHFEERYPSETCACGGDAGGGHVDGCPNATDLDVVAQAAAEAPERDEPADVLPIAGGGRKVSASQIRMLGALWSKLGVGDEDRRAYTETLIGHELDGGTTKSLTMREASFLLDGLAKITTVEQLEDAIAARIAGAGDQGGDQ